MFAGKVMRRCLIPAAAVVGEASKDSKGKEQADKNVCRPSELPIYTKDPPVKRETESSDEPPTFLTNYIRSARESIEKVSNEMSTYKKVAIESFNEGKQEVDWVVDYLRQENNILPKAGAIGIGALTGLIFGLRGGIFKRTLYSTTGALGMAAVCYPKEAAEYSEIGLIEGKKYLTIAYNFMYGVKKDEPPLELPSLPKVPTSLTEAWDSVKSTFVSDESKPAPIDAKATEKVSSLDMNKVSVESKNPASLVSETHLLAMSSTDSCMSPVENSKENEPAILLSNEKTNL